MKFYFYFLLSIVHISAFSQEKINYNLFQVKKESYHSSDLNSFEFKDPSIPSIECVSTYQSFYFPKKLSFFSFNCYQKSFLDFSTIQNIPKKSDFYISHPQLGNLWIDRTINNNLDIVYQMKVKTDFYNVISNPIIQRNGLPKN